jgi:hypothetical protein
LNLPILQKITSLLNKSPKSEYYIVFLIDSKIIKVAVWEKNGSKINILKIAKEEFSGSLDDLIEISDRAISKASFGIPAERLNQVIFSVPSSWSEDGKIQQNYLKFLKNICIALSLKPLGFVITTDAMVKQYEIMEHNKFSSLLLHVAPEVLNFSLIEHGEVKECVSSLRSEKNIAEDFLEVLGRFQATILPNRILLFDGRENLEEVRQEILKLPLTQKEKRFLHFPSVEILEENADIVAVVKTVGKEMGAAFIGEEKITEGVIRSVAQEEKVEEKKEEKAAEVEKKEEVIEPEEKKVENVEIENLGFIYDRDVAVTQPIVVSTPEPERVEKKENKNLAPDFPLRTGIIIVVGVCLALLIAFISYWFFFSRATLALAVKTSTFKNDVDITLTKQETSAKDSLLGKEISVAVSQEKEAGASGKKKTGEKAHGEVVIFNKNTDAPRKFAKGTEISYNDLKFTLDEDVNVASASMQTEAGQETKIFGKTNAKVTAEKFGNEYNIGDNKDFSVDNFAQSSFSAHNDRAFSGGTTREVQVVSKEDQADLLKSLASVLEEKAKKQIAERIDKKTEDILNKFVTKKILEKKYSTEVDEEAKKFSLNLKMEFMTYAYKKDDVKKILDKILKNKIPSGYFLDQNSIKLALKNSKETEIGYDLTFSYEVRAIPKINLQETSNKIQGVFVKNLDKYLLNGEVKSYTVKISPDLPGIFNTMPHRAENIKIKLEY